MAHKLDDAGALNCGGQLLGAVERIQARHGWTDGDLVAVLTVTFTELVARTVGEFRAVEFFRDHADHLERQILDRAP